MEATAGLQMSQPRPVPCLASTASKVAELADAHQMEQLLAGIGKMLAQVIVDRSTSAREFRFQNLGDQGCASAAGAGRAGGFLQCAKSGAAGPDSGADGLLVTLLHEQICAFAGSAATPVAVDFLSASSAGRISASGRSGSGWPFCTICSRVP